MNKQDQNNAQETIVIDQINAEREKIAQLLASPLSDLNKLGVFEKYFLADCALLKILGQTEVRDVFFKEEPLPIIDQLQAQLEALREELSFVGMQVKSKEEEKTRLKKSIHDLEQIRKNVSVDELINENNLPEVEANVVKRFKFEKSRLKTVLGAIWPTDKEACDLISQLVQDGVKNPGTYVTLDANQATQERIGMLLRTNLFEVNPLDPNQMRMVDLT